MKIKYAIIASLVLVALITVWVVGNRTNATRRFSTSTSQLQEASSIEIVSLSNGDTYDLTAAIVKKTVNGQEMKMLAYNGSIPGPLIKVTQGAEITLKFTNNTDADSTIHSHGVRVDNQFDGVADVTQDPVKPGQSFTYKLKFLDPGIFWYHPHIREDYAQELGLYGNFIVTPQQSYYWAEVEREEALFLDDILIENGQIAPFDSSEVTHTLMGRFGNTMLINADNNYQLSVKQGERVRLYITNAANTRVFNVSIPNTRMKLVGADNGKYEREQWVESVTLGPSERSIVEIWFEQDGEYQIMHSTPEKSYSMGSIVVTTAPVATSYLLIPRINQDLIDSLSLLRPLFSKSPDKNLTLTLEMGGGMMNGNGNQSGGGMQHMMRDGQMMQNEDMQMNMGSEVEKIEWEDDMGMMNAGSTAKTLKWKLIDEATGRENMDLGWQFQKGDIVKIKLFNDDKSMHPMQHPIHIHGQRFLVVSTNGVLNDNLVWKDTALIQTGDTVEFLVQMDNPGDWVIHCHIPEHMESGMMGSFKVI